MGTVKVARKQKRQQFLKPILSFATLWKYWYVFFITIVFFLVIAVVFNKVVTPSYRIGSKILIKQENSGRSAPSQGDENINAINAFQQNYNVYNEMHVVRSVELIEKAIRNLNFNVSYFTREDFTIEEHYRNSPFTVVFDPNLPQPVDIRFKIDFIDKNTIVIRAKGKQVKIYNFKENRTLYREEKLSFKIKAKTNAEIKTDYFNFMVIPDEGIDEAFLTENTHFFRFNSMENLVLKYNDAINTSSPHILSSVLVIEMNVPNVEKGIDFLDELMRQYENENLDTKNYMANTTLGYIESQLGKVSDTLNLTAQRLQNFQSRYHLIDIPTKAQSLTLQLQTLEEQKFQTEQRFNYYQYINKYLTENREITDMIAPSSMGVEETLLNSLIQELISLFAQKKSLIDNNQQLNPYFKTVESRIDNNKKTLIENIKFSLNTTQLALEDLNQRVTTLRGEIQQLPLNERELANIKRLYDLNDAVYTYLLQRNAEAEIAKASNLPDNMVIESARMIGDSPVFPMKKVNLVFALLLSLLFAVGFILIKERTQDKISSFEEIKNYTDLTSIGNIIHNDTESNLAMIEHSQSGIAESIRLIRTNLQFYSRTEGSKIILITSSVGFEGKSMLAVNLALSFAMNNSKTLLLGMDLRKPKLTDYLKISSIIGVSNYLINAATFADIVIQTEYPNLDYISSGEIPPNPSELLGDKTRMEQFFLHLRSQYDVIIVDTAPLGLVSDTFQLLDYSDTIIYVVRQNVTPRSLFAQIMEEIEEKEISKMAIAPNDFGGVSRKSYGYRYGYYHKSKHKGRMMKKLQ